MAFQRQLTKVFTHGEYSETSYSFGRGFTANIIKLGADERVFISKDGVQFYGHRTSGNAINTIRREIKSFGGGQ